MVRKGSPVRVRQRALSKSAATSCVCRSGERRARGVDVHGTCTSVHVAAGAAVVVEQLDGVVVAVAGEVAEGAVDVDEAGAHVARELVGAEAGAQHDGGERVPQTVEATGRVDAGGALRGAPMPRPPVVEVEVAALRGRRRAALARWVVRGSWSSASSADRWSGTARAALVLVGSDRPTGAARRVRWS
jgi:hypothetical protein